jgi:hypothetical protein
MLSLTGFFSYNIKTVYYGQGREITNRPSDKDRMGVRTLGWWVLKASDRDRRILFHESLLNVEIICFVLIFCVGTPDKYRWIPFETKIFCY